MSHSSESYRILRDGKIKFKIHSANIFLESIPAIVPLEVDSDNRIKTEIDIQCFLFFSIGAIDICYHNVNEKLSLGILPHKFSFPKFQEKLEEKTLDSNDAKLILDDLWKYTQEPTYVESPTTKALANQYAEDHLDGNWGLEFWSRFENRGGNWFEHIWNRKNSSLWELRKLRNSITHGAIIKQSREQRNSHATDGLAVPLKHEIGNFREQYFVLNPHQYFSNSFRDVKEHIDIISRILEH